MRILFLCKRRPQQRDLLTRPYGRFFYLPYHLAQQGHDVTLLLLGYAAGPTYHCHAHGMEWYVESLGPLLRNAGPLAYIRRARKLLASEKFDWIVGFSDTWFGILAVYLGWRYGVKSLIDAYDNYESYIPWAKPLHWLWRFALRKADVLTAAGPQLAELMAVGREGDRANVIPMAADPMFMPINKKGLRRLFDLPDGVPLIGYCGALYRNRGVEVLFKSMEYLLAWAPDAKLVISGRKEKGLKIPKSIVHAVINLGYIPDEQMPLLINAIDVLTVINRHSSFGNYSYPVKLYEAMQCQKPIVASNTLSVEWVLRWHSECLVATDDAEILARQIFNSLALKSKQYGICFAWEHSATLFADLLVYKSGN